MSKPERLARRTVYSSNWVNLHLDRVRFPAGRIVEEHHVLDFPFEAVGVLVENDRDELLFVRAYRYVTDAVEWEIPAGRIEEGESAAAAAKREVEEESGCRTEGHQEVYSYYPMNGIANQLFHIVRCRATSGTGEFDRNEVAEVRWFPRREVRRMIAAGEIRDGFSLSGLLLYLLPLDSCAE
jgi:ADP-ribose pyrophosphatase